MFSNSQVDTQINRVALLDNHPPSPLSHMSLTCQERPAALYPLLPEAQPSNSCWQSCLSPNQPLT